jgi:hypothetical protein
MAHFAFGIALAVMLSVPFVRHFLQCGRGTTAGNLLAGTVTVRHPASLPEAVPSLHGNWLLERRALEKMRISSAVRR